MDPYDVRVGVGAGALDEEKGVEGRFDRLGAATRRYSSSVGGSAARRPRGRLVAISRSWWPARRSSTRGSGSPCVTRSRTPSTTSGERVERARHLVGQVVGWERPRSGAAPVNEPERWTARKVRSRFRSTCGVILSRPERGTVWNRLSYGPSNGGRAQRRTVAVPAVRPAAAPATERPNPMLNGHRAWLDGPVGAAAE